MATIYSTYIPTGIIKYAIAQYQAQQNLLKYWNQSTSQERKIGWLWYHRANLEATQAAKQLNVDPEVFIGIVALISPMLRWEINILYAKRLVLWFQVGGNPYKRKPPKKTGSMFSSNTRKAFDLWQGKPFRSGPKVTAFRECILHPDTSQSACIDSHAILALLDIPQINGAIQFDAGVYSIAEKAYRDTANRIGVPVAQFQATIWTVYRNSNSYLNGNNSRQERAS